METAKIAATKSMKGKGKKTLGRTGPMMLLGTYDRGPHIFKVALNAATGPPEAIASENPKRSSKSNEKGKRLPASLPAMPKAPLTAYNFFYKEQCLIIQTLRDYQLATNNETEDTHLKGRDRFIYLTRVIGKRWLGLSPSQSQRFKVLAQKDQERYRRELKLHQEFHRTKQTPKKKAKKVKALTGGHRSDSYRLSTDGRKSSARGPTNVATAVGSTRVASFQTPHGSAQNPEQDSNKLSSRVREALAGIGWPSEASIRHGQDSLSLLQNRPLPSNLNRFGFSGGLLPMEIAQLSDRIGDFQRSGTSSSTTGSFATSLPPARSHDSVGFASPVLDNRLMSYASASPAAHFGANDPVRLVDFRNDHVMANHVATLGGNIDPSPLWSMAPLSVNNADPRSISSLQVNSSASDQLEESKGLPTNKPNASLG